MKTRAEQLRGRDALAELTKRCGMVGDVILARRRRRIPGGGRGEAQTGDRPATRFIKESCAMTPGPTSERPTPMLAFLQALATELDSLTPNTAGAWYPHRRD